MPPGSAPVPSLRRCVCTRRFIVAGPPKVLSGPCRQARRRHSAGGGLGIQLSCELWVGSRSPSTRDNRDARLKEPSLLPQLHSTVAIISHRLPCALRRCASECRPNRFGRSFGRKLGVLYDDYVKNVFVFTRRRSQVRVLSRPPFISSRYKRREELEGVVVTWIVM